MARVTRQLSSAQLNRGSQRGFPSGLAARANQEMRLWTNSRRAAHNNPA